MGEHHWQETVASAAKILIKLAYCLEEEIDGVKRGARIARMMEHERWDRVFSATCVGVLWQLRSDQRNLVRPVVHEAEAQQGVAPVIVMPAVPKVDRRRYVTK